MKRFLCFLIVFAFIAVTFIPAQEEAVPAEAKEKKLTLKEAIFTALKNNLNLQISMIDAENSRNSVKIYNGEFIPSLTIDFLTDETNTPSTGVLDGAAVVKNERLQLNLTLSQKLTIGGTLNVQLSNNRRESLSLNLENP